MSTLITGQQAKKEYKKHLWYGRKQKENCCCGVIIDNENVVAAETEKNINGADVPILEFFCSEHCAHEWLDNVETKKETV